MSAGESPGLLPPVGQSPAAPVQERRYWDEECLVLPLTRQERSARPGYSAPTNGISLSLGEITDTSHSFGVFLVIVQNYLGLGF